MARAILHVVEAEYPPRLILVLVHGYFTVKLDIVVEKDLPNVKRYVGALLAAD